MIYVLGFSSQVLFFTRTLIQWVLSERSKKVLSPTIYWILSIVASYLFVIYGWFRNDFAILLGQFISYYIYIWNLNETGIWKRITPFIRSVLDVTPFIAVGFVIYNRHDFIDNFLVNEKIPGWLIIFGIFGQILFSLRFVYQWLYSLSRNESLLPIGFWLISLIGSVIIVIYGIFRVDPILILGQSVGLIAYTRNIFIYKKEQIK
ncbi:lipid-A-disaccharide synthase N-terminal domain-containing protein [Bacteroides graminisolvens]|uniref:lipid-A-disaccharide synthase N-terminal domain-containing protein n=1 Tax=Bacteroides graminisolvens TaxID=477666 RepID=UPI0023F2EFBE|nr:lipid-A-disaccharide synthase N-terminal domain-containing protein [Bacteroides graminisolvens]MDD3211982.1 lipid-A-disaccharide synthase N-terminal domain-containing protein [Bacteroides graminisolvens]